MLEGPGNQASQNLSKTDAKIPESKAGGLFAPRIPLAAHKHEQGWDAGFEDTTKHSCCDQRVEPSRGRDTCRCNAPGEQDEAEILGSRDPLEQED